MAGYRITRQRFGHLHQILQFHIPVREPGQEVIFTPEGHILAQEVGIIGKGKLGRGDRAGLKSKIDWHHLVLFPEKTVIYLLQHRCLAETSLSDYGRTQGDVASGVCRPTQQIGDDLLPVGKFIRRHTLKNRIPFLFHLAISFIHN